jgi:hypothetical protein
MVRLGTFSYPGLESFRTTSQGLVRMVRTLVTGQLAEAWAILRRHPHGPELAQHSVNPYLVGGVRKVVSGRKAAVQRAGGPDLLRFTKGELVR